MATSVHQFSNKTSLSQRNQPCESLPTYTKEEDTCPYHRKNMSLSEALDDDLSLDTRHEKGKRYTNISSFVLVFLLGLISDTRTANAIRDMLLYETKLAAAVGMSKVPSLSTISRSLASLRVESLQEAFYMVRDYLLNKFILKHINKKQLHNSDLHIAVDGKWAASTTRPKANSNKNDVVLIVSAWCKFLGLTLAVGGGDCPPRTSKSNGKVKYISESSQMQDQIIPRLKEFADKYGVHPVISTDAAAAGAPTIQAILNADMHYLTAIRGNSKNLFREFLQIQKLELDPDETCETLERNKGRNEYRIVRLYKVSRLLAEHPEFENLKKWSIEHDCKVVAFYKTKYYADASKDFSQTIGTKDQFIVGKRVFHKQNSWKPKDNNSYRTGRDRFFVSSKDYDAALLLKHVREHWGVENNLHHTLDTLFKEDNNNYRGVSATNMAILERFALNYMQAASYYKLFKASSLGNQQKQIGRHLMQFASMFHLIKPKKAKKPASTRNNQVSVESSQALETECKKMRKALRQVGLQEQEIQRLIESHIQIQSCNKVLRTTEPIKESILGNPTFVVDHCIEGHISSTEKEGLRPLSPTINTVVSGVKLQNSQGSFNMPVL